MDWNKRFLAHLKRSKAASRLLRLKHIQEEENRIREEEATFLPEKKQGSKLEKRIRRDVRK